MSSLKRILSGLVVAALFILIYLPLSSAQQPSTSVVETNQGLAVLSNREFVRAEAPTPDEVVASFLQAEAIVRESLNQFTFKREVVLQTVGPSGEITGEYIRHSQFIFDDRGSRLEQVTYHPPSTIREMRITREDIQDLAGAQLLGIDVTETAKYAVSFIGSDVLDSTPVFVLTVAPRTKPDPHHMAERYFRGRLWIDAQTFQILKVRGTVEPQGKQRFPIFETFRTRVGDSLFLPTRTEADDVLRFPNRNVNYRIRVRYYDYKLFASKLKITEIDEPQH